MDILLVALGLPALLLGGDLLVSGAVAVARRLGLSPMVIGLTLVGFGTSAPELITSLRAALQGNPGIALGNVVGSNICNILLILGIAALIRPFPVAWAGFRRDGGWVLLAAVACIALALLPVISRGAGAGLLVLLGLFLWQALRGPVDAVPDLPDEPMRSLPRSLLIFAGGLGLTLVGAFLLVDGATGIARSLGVSEAVIGLTLVALGTSLPELVTTIQAARRGHGDVALGNVLGSNIFNVLGILGTTALVTPLAVDPQIAGFDVWVMGAATLLLLIAGFTGGRFTRGEGLVMLSGYGLYLGWLTRTVL